MPINYDGYRTKATEACNEVFNNEYSRSIGIPSPEVNFILPDSPNYKSGEYFIKIGDTWQIFLNFGLLPVSYREFQQEVKVLTRHEIEHYLCCPFDVLTHFKILNKIIQTYCDHYSNLSVNIVELAGSLANQIADVIVDTKNFRSHRSETLSSEKAWIDKTCPSSFKKLPRHSKLMFLLKEALWGESLGLNEDDEELLKSVKELAEIFEMSGITDKNLFLDKAIAYTHLFFKLFQQNKEESGSQNSGTESNQVNQPLIVPPKDSHQGGSSFIFQAPEKIKQAIEQLAQEISIQQFSQVLSAAGINTLSDKEKQQIWFEAQNSEVIPISELSPKGGNDNYSYPTIWKAGDPIEDLDMMLSYATSPIIIPGVTTKKWVQKPVFNMGSENKEADLLLVLDKSGSMGMTANPQSNLHQAVLACYGILKYFENNNALVSLITFSDQVNGVEWSKDYELIRQELLVNGEGGTRFPIENIQSTICKAKNSVVTVVITDGEINNLQQTLDYFSTYLGEGNKLFMFLQDSKSMIINFKSLIDLGAKIARTLTAAEIRNTVLNELF